MKSSYSKKAQYQVIQEIKCKYPRKSLSHICRLFGITRQAFYQHNWAEEDLQTSHLLIINEVKRIRENHRQMGARKLYTLLEPFLIEHSIKLGRDGLFNLLAANHLLIRKRKRRVQTTYSAHWLRKYPNRIKDIVSTRINQIWVSDITYWNIKPGENLYISLITDAYSRKIIGFNVASTMEAVESIKALQMALRSFKQMQPATQMIHHSDRGIQYCSGKYVKLLQDYGIQISMTEAGDPLDNPIAERVNGILKQEYLEHYETNNLQEATRHLAKAVELYNNQRPHMSISNLPPEKVHSQDKLAPQRLWKNYWKKLNIFNQTYPVNLLQDLSSKL